MAAIAALTENFEGAAAGSALTISNSFFTTVTTPAPTFFADSVEGTRCMLSATPGSSSACRIDFTNSTTVWLSFYFKPKANAATSTALMAFYDNAGTNKIGDLRFLTGGTTLQLRSVNTAVWDTGTNLTIDQWYRIEVGIVTGTSIQVKVYTGANLHSSTTTSFNSGVQSNTGTVATACGSVRIGQISADTTMQFQVDRFRGDNAAAPAPIVTGVDASVTAVSAQAFPTFVAPSVQIGSQVTGGGPVASSAQAFAPVVSATQNPGAIVSPPASASGLARTPAVGGGTVVQAVPATAAAAMRAPTPSNGEMGTFVNAWYSDGTAWTQV